MAIYTPIECASCGCRLSRRDAHPIKTSWLKISERISQLFSTSSRLRRRRPRRREEEAWLCADCQAAAQVQSRSRVVLVASIALIGMLAFGVAYIANNAPKQANTATAKLESDAAHPVVVSSRPPQASRTVLASPPVANDVAPESRPQSAPIASSQPAFNADLTDASNAVQIQNRLTELGYLRDTADGRWGPKSRNALRAFKQANGFSGDDKWDGPTASLLFGPNALRAPVNLPPAAAR